MIRRIGQHTGKWCNNLDPDFQFLVDEIVELALRLIVGTVVPPVLIVYVHLAQFTVAYDPSGIEP